MAWNRCDVCGRFIAYKDFDSGEALRRLVSPDSLCTYEEYETLCKDHKDRQGREAYIYYA